MIGIAHASRWRTSDKLESGAATLPPAIHARICLLGCGELHNPQSAICDGGSWPASAASCVRPCDDPFHDDRPFPTSCSPTGASPRIVDCESPPSPRNGRESSARMKHVF